MAIENEVASAATGEAISCLRYGMEKIEHCVRQLNDDQVWWRPIHDMNSIGNLMLHLAGNLGQWIVAGVGDAKDIRERQQEFDQRDPIAKEEVVRQLTEVIAQAAAALANASAQELLANKRIQGRDVTKMKAMMHSVTHFQGHVQEIICLTRWQLGDRYEFHWQPQTKEEGAT